MKKDDIINYNTVKYHYMIEYLLFSNDILSDIEPINTELNDILFLDVLDTLRLNLFSNNYYPKKVFTNFEKLINYLENYYNDNQLLDELKMIKNDYNQMEKNSGNKIYVSEFEYKTNDIKSYANNNCFIWNVNEIEKLFEFDYGAVLSFNVKGDTYFEHFFPIYICNQNYIYFIQKLLIEYPTLFLIPKIKQKVINILEYNKTIIEEMDINELIEEFAKKNYNSDIKHIKSNYPEYFTKFANFIELSNKLLDRVNNINKKNYDQSFNINELINIYYYTFIEKQFIDKEEIKENPILLGHIYSYIEQTLNNINDRSINNKLNDMMHICRKELPKSELQNYNEHLGLLNVGNENGIKFIDHVEDSKLNLLEQLKLSHDVSKYEEYYKLEDLLDTLVLDHNVIKSFICDDLEFETLYLNHFIYSDDFVLAIKKMLDIYPNLFTDYTIHQRTILVFNAIIDKYKQKELNSKEFYKKNEKIKKKVEKIYYGK